MSTIILNVCTVPCVEAGRAIHQLGKLSEDGVYKAMMHLQHQRNGTESLPLNQHRIVAIAMVRIEGELVTSIDFSNDLSEEALLTRLAEEIDNTSTVVCWNGRDFDLPVIAYRLLRYGIHCPDFWANYTIPLADSHFLDLQSVLSGYSTSARAAFTEMCRVLELPDHSGLASIDVLDEFRQGDIAKISQANEADALNCLLLYVCYCQTKESVPDINFAVINRSVEQYLRQSKQNQHTTFSSAV